MNIPAFMTKADYLRQIDMEVARLEDGIVALVKQRAEMKRRRNAVSCAVNLPSEVLAYIFEFAILPDSPLEDRTPNLTNRNVTTTPLLLGSVCHSWRNVAWRASQLWSDISLRVRHRRVHSQVKLLHQWLRRANNRLLRIKLLEDDPINTGQETTDDDLSSSDEFSGRPRSPGTQRRNALTERDGGWGIDVSPGDVLSALAAHSDQWKSIDIFVPFSWRSILDAVRFRLPNLTTLTLRTADGSPTLATIPHFHFAPRLRDVTLIGYSICDVDLPYGQLERLAGEHFTPGECLSALVLCPSLRRCQFEQIRTGTGEDLWTASLPPSLAPAAQPTTPSLPPSTSYHHFLLPDFTSLFETPRHPLPAEICHLNLKSLELVIDSQFDIGPFLGRLSLPNLEEFVLSVPDNSESSLLTHTIPLLQRSLAPLRLLHLVGATPPEDLLVECLRMLPGLTRLYLINPEVGGEFGVGAYGGQGAKLSGRLLHMLRPQLTYAAHGMKDMDHATLLPCLREFEYRGDIAFQPGELVELVAARWSASSGTSIQSTSGWYGDHIDMVSMDHVESVARLEKITLTTGRRLCFKEEHQVILQALRAEGLKFDVQIDS